MTSQQRELKAGFVPSDVAQATPLITTTTNKLSALPTLAPTQESMKEFWNKLWEINSVAWKIQERKQGEELYMKNINNLLGNSSEEDKIKFDRFFDPKNFGVHVFVPLCGDTGILAFLFQTGFSVTGVDCAEKALQNVIAEASSNLPAGIEVVWETKEIQDSQTKIFIGKAFSTSGETKTELNQITLICGDFFQAPLDMATNNKGFDIIYDRASGIAIPVSLREQYFNKILSCCLRREKRNENELFKNISKDFGTCVFFGIMQRSAETKAKNAGPPFFFSPEELQEKFYTKERNFEFKVLEYATEEECAAIPSGIIEGVANIYQKIVS